MSWTRFWHYLLNYVFPIAGFLGAVACVIVLFKKGHHRSKLKQALGQGSKSGQLDIAETSQRAIGDADMEQTIANGAEATRISISNSRQENK
jgi:hypothetical protein